MTADTLAVLLVYAFPLFLIVLGYVTGSIIERRHYADIRAREETHRGFPVTTFETLPADWSATGTTMVSGSVVVSIDYFKRFAARLRTIFGGRIRAYEPLLDRGRREALLRMTEQAREAGFDAVINTRIETSSIGFTADARSSTTGIEILAFGTALRLKR